MDFRGLKKVCTVNSDENDKVSLVERVFQTHLQTSSDSLAHAIVSLQQYDAEWEDLVDIDMAQIKHRDKIKVQIIDNRDPDNSRKSSTRTTDGTSAAGLDSPASVERVNKPGVGVEQLTKTWKINEELWITNSASQRQNWNPLKSLQGTEVLQEGTQILPAAVAITKVIESTTACCNHAEVILNVASCHYTENIGMM